METGHKQDKQDIILRQPEINKQDINYYRFQRPGISRRWFPGQAIGHESHAGLGQIMLEEGKAQVSAGGLAVELYPPKSTHLSIPSI
jgi:hypothetical protein